MANRRIVRGLREDSRSPSQPTLEVWKSAFGLLSVIAILLTSTSIATAQDLKFEKYQLDNGLTVILHEDHTLPQATINLWYRVGALNEPPGRSGFAHLFEHLMFMGTQRVPHGDFDKLMEGKGGSNNASTALERTNYFSSGPSTLLPTLLWLDADRMEDLGPSIDEKKLKLQCDVVRNEIRQQVENQPYAKAYEASFRYMYPVGHPYHNAVYGTHEDLEAATVENVHDFFATFYTPGNCSLVVAGDFKTAEIKPLVAKLFGDLPRGNAPAQKAVPIVKLDRVQRATLLDKVPQSRIEFVYHSPGYYEPGDSDMDLAGAILAGGPSSRLYKRLVIDEQIATDVSAVQESSRGSSLFRLNATAKPGVDLQRLEKEMNEEVATFQSKGPTEEELTQRKNIIEQGKLSGLQALGTRADKLNEYEYYFGTPDGLERDMNRYRSATVAQVRDTAARVLTANARLVMEILPESREGREPSNRDKQPGDLPTRPFTPPQPQTFSLSNGVNVQLFPREQVPLVAMTLLLAPGHPIDTLDQAGLASLTAEMTQQGAAGKDAVAFAEAAELLGADIGAAADFESLHFSLNVLKRNLAPATGLLADSLLKPNLDAKDFEREKAIAVDDILQELEEPGAIARRVATRAFFGPLRRSTPVSGTPKTVQSLTLEQVRAKHQELIDPKTATLVIAGDVKLDEARQLLESAFGSKAWPSASKGTAGPNGTASVADTTSAPTQPAAPPKVVGQKVLLVDRPGSTQTTLLYMAPSVAIDDPSRIGLMLVNTVLGGSFTSRLNQNLRETHGYTYGAGSRLTSLQAFGYFSASASVRTEVTGESLKEMLAELQKIGSQDLSDGEAGKSRDTVRTDLIDSYGTLQGVLGRATGQILLGQSPDAPAKELTAIEKMDLGQLQKLSKTLVDAEHSVIVIVGDEAKIRPQWDQLKLPAFTEETVLGDPKKK